MAQVSKASLPGHQVSAVESFEYLHRSPAKAPALDQTFPDSPPTTFASL
jgi:hypothetical protein